MFKSAILLVTVAFATVNACHKGQTYVNGHCYQIPTGCYQTVQDASEYFNCPAGHACPEPHLLPQICAAGTFNRASENCNGHSECTKVPLGCYQEEAGQENFKMCPEGFFCEHPDKSPVPCPAGTISSKSDLCIDHTSCVEVGAKAGMIRSFLVGTCSYKQQVNVQIKSLAGSTSQGLCAKYVREAVQRAEGVPVVPTGIESAKDYGPWLIKQGYSATSKKYTEAVTGDIAVMAGQAAHPHGHITVKCDDGRWRSDFVQNNFFPYKDGSQPSYVIYS